MRNRATILVGAAAVGLVFLSSHVGVWSILAAVAAIFAAAFGVMTLLVRGKGPGLVVRGLRNSAFDADAYSVEWQLVDDKLVEYEFDEHSLNIKLWMVRTGFFALVFSWGCALVALMGAA